MGTMTSQITSFMIVYSTIYSTADQRKHQRPASLAFVRGFHRWPVNSRHKGPVTRKMFLFDDIMFDPSLYLRTGGTEHPHPTTVYSDADQRKHQRPASLAFVRGFHRWPVNSRHKGPVTRKMFLFDDIMFDPSLYLRTGGTEHPHPTTEYPYPLPPPHPNCSSASEISWYAKG